MPSSKEFFKLDLKNKLILVRVDLNLPVINGVVQDETRLQSVLPTIQEIIKKGGKVVLCSHFGRPNGEYNKKYSLKPLICLLYTSPSPRDLSTSRMPSSA